MLLVTLSSEIHIKSSRTRRRFIRILLENLRERLRREAPGAHVDATWDRIHITGSDLERAAQASLDVFGVQRVDRVRRLSFRDLDDLAQQAEAAARERVAGKTFAVRVRRRGNHSWSSLDAERLIGSRLLPYAEGVNLDQPGVTVRIQVQQDEGYLVEDTQPGPDGLPLGVQGRALTLLSGGFDSAVAAWLIMRRGVPVDFLHFTLDCAQSEHATAVAFELIQRWGHGKPAYLHLVDFQPVKDALMQDCDPRLRQVVLKQFMVAAADRVARSFGHLALVTGEAVGQVSSQTLEHLAAIDSFGTETILRPLSGMTKQDIIALSRRVGTHNLSTRAREVCDLSEGPVAVAATRRQLAQAHRRLDPDLVAAALNGWRMIDIRRWQPGGSMIPVVHNAPPGIPLIHAGRDAPPAEGPLVVTGRRATEAAAELHADGREVYLQVETPASSPR
ncbi:MAG: tRNA 4-thiouridine(8) synthase ThiI [Candidatus Eisenbacteria bacterium]|nr:tRNA 4-thiouridine(8) synthase ThiI [Candidatus Eisenbacteria bacterium]